MTGVGIHKQSVGARNRVGTGLSYPWDRFLGSLKNKKFGHYAVPGNVLVYALLAISLPHLLSYEFIPCDASSIVFAFPFLFHSFT